MRHLAEEFATLSEQHMTAADHARSRDKRQMHLEIAHHYARIAALKGEQRTNVLELHPSGAGNRHRT